MRLVRTAEGYEYWIPDANEAEGNPLYSPSPEQTNVQPQLALPVELPSGDDVSDLPTFKVNYNLGNPKDTRPKEEKLSEMFGVVPGPEGPLDLVKSFVSGLTAPGEVAKGEVEQGDMLSRAIDTAGLGVTGPLAMKPGTASLGSGMTRMGLNDELKNRIVPAIKNLKTGEILTVPRGQGHDDLLLNYYQKIKGDPNLDYLKIIEKGLDDNATGFYDPKTKQFFDRGSKGFEDLDSTSLMTEAQAKKYQEKLNLLYSDPSKIGKAVSVAQQSAKPFFTNVEASLAKIPMKSGTAEQWTNAFKRYGAGKEELEWTVGELPKGQITRQQIEQHLKDNAVQLNEVWKGKNYSHDRLVEINNRLNDIQNEFDNLHRFNNQSANERRALLAKEEETLKTERNKINSSPVKYSQYQMPGGTNYRELLLTLPEKSSNEDKIKFLMSKGYNRQDAKTLADREFGVESYRSSHWDEPNVIAHVRMNDRTIPDVGKSLHLEEIQSDWHQAGRKQGYNIPVKPENYVLEGNGPWVIRNKETGEFVHDFNNKQNAEGYLKDIHKGLILPWRGDKLPNAPFKNNWDELALKKVIRQAVEEGYDAISWTPGKHQSTNPSKQIKNVYLNDPVWFGENDIRGNLVATGLDGNDIITKKVTSRKEIEELIGKKGADELIDKPTSMQGRDHVLKGEGLDTGGTKEFYDKILVDKANKLVKQFGGKVEKVELNKPKLDKFNSTIHINGKIQMEKADIWTVKLTPELKKHALEKGFSLFSTTPVLIPVEHDPFTTRQHKLTKVDFDPFAE